MTVSFLICVSSAQLNFERRKAVRKSWFKFLQVESSIFDKQQLESIHAKFSISSGNSEVEQEARTYEDIVQLGVQEGYQHLWRRTLTFMEHMQAADKYDYFMHVDDDSFVRLDLLIPLLERSAREQFYWGYIWDGSGSRKTHPIRNPNNKSYMPEEQYNLSYYPPFASGCGFVLSKDLVQALLKQPLPDYRLLDPPFGIHLCGSERCILEVPIQPLHDDRVLPYPPMPIFIPTTIIQHYLAPMQMMYYYQKAMEVISGSVSEEDLMKQIENRSSHKLFKELTSLGLLKR